VTAEPLPPDRPEVPPPVFREFLYADVDRVRSLLAQRLGGVPEEGRTTENSIRQLTIGAKQVLGASREDRAESYEQRSLVDALFPELEALLEAEGWLTDISDEFHSSSAASYPELRLAIAPGSIIRLTAPGVLFDTAYLAHSFAGTAAAASGISALAEPPTPASPTRPGTRNSEGRRPDRSNAPGPGVGERLEDSIESFPPGLMGDVTAETMRAMVKVSRGMFADGLHLILGPCGVARWTATARLQKGRRHLDAEPEILFARYGMTPTDWTVVGTIGYFSEPDDPDVSSMDFLNSDGTASRIKMVKGLNKLLTVIARQGFADRPQPPGFTIVPLAVYRLIPPARPAT
jgi:hypothetical protein